MAVGLPWSIGLNPLSSKSNGIREGQLPRPSTSYASQYPHPVEMLMFYDVYPREVFYMFLRTMYVMCMLFTFAVAFVIDY